MPIRAELQPGIVRGELILNIQIFGTKKSSDTRKAERFFKERGIKFQSIDLKDKGLSKGEFKLCDAGRRGCGRND